MSLPVILAAQAKQDLRDIWRGLTEFGSLKRAGDGEGAIGQILDFFLLIDRPHPQS